MSIFELLTPLSVGKTYMDINVNSINVGAGGASFQGAINGPLTISQNSASGVPIVTINETNPAANNSNVGLKLSNQSGSETLQLLTLNDPIAATAIITAGTGPMSITTSSSSSQIGIFPNGVSALNASYVGSGVTSTAIQNLLLPTVGGIPTYLNYYEEVSPFLMTFTGPWGTGQTYQRNVYISAIGIQVTMRIDAIEQMPPSGGAFDITTTGAVIPSRFVPIGSADEPDPVFTTIPVFDNGNSTLGSFRIQPDGSLIITSSNTTTPVFSTFHPATNTKVGFPNLFISYSI